MRLPAGSAMQGSVREYDGSRVISVLTEKI